MKLVDFISKTGRDFGGKSYEKRDFRFKLFYAP